jgi:hypothetical protein
MISKKGVEKETLRDLEDLAANLLEAARKLRPGLDRNDILKEIGQFRVRITALKVKSGK